MPSVGTAYVNIRVNTKGFEKSLETMLARLSKQMEAGGKKLGDDFVKGLSSSNTEKFFRDLELRGQKASTKMSNDFKKVERSLDDVGLTASDAGDMMQSSFAKTSPVLKNVSNDLRKISSTSKDVERSGRRASSSLSRMGAGGGGFRSAANDAGFFGRALNSLSREGVGARKWLSGLHDSLAFTGSAAGLAIGGLSAAAQGIFAVGAQAAATAPALSVFAGGLIGLAQVGSVVAISMHGVGAALTAGFKSVDKSAATAGKAVGGMGKATAAAARAVRDAKQNLARAYQDAARAAADANRRVIDAEKALAAAQRDSAAAQKALNDARAVGLQQLKDIGFAAEDAALAEDRAALSLADAQQQLDATAGLAPDDRMRVEAELSFKEADLQMREAKNRREQADKDQQKAAKSGVEGTDAMIQGHKDVADAQDAEAKAGQDLADARRDQARTAQDNAQKIADAQQAVADAQKSLADAQKQTTGATKAATTAADAYKTALDKLSPNQQAFVKRIIALGPQFKAARDKIADPLFGGLLDGLNTVTKSPFWDQMVGKLSTTSGVLGDLVRDGANAATKPPFSTSLFKVMDNNQGVIKNFGTAAGNVAGALVQIADAAGPVLTDFSEWVSNVTGAWNQTETLDNRTGKLDTTIRNAAGRVSDFKDLFYQLWQWLKKVGGAAVDASDNFKWFDKKGDAQTGYIPKLTASLKEFNKHIDRSKLVDRFTTALHNLDSEGSALKSAIIDPLLIMGGDKRVGNAFDIIAKSDSFKDLAKQAGEAGPVLATLVVNLVDLFNSLSKTGSLKNFVDILGTFVGFLADMVGLVPVPVLKGIGDALGVIAALRFTGFLGKKIFSAFVPPPGMLDKLTGLPGSIRGTADKAVQAGVVMEEAGYKVAIGFETGFGAGMKEVGLQAVRAVKAALPKTGLIAAGGDLVAGLELGIEEATPSVVLAAEEMAKAALAAIKGIWKIKSPSLVASEIGVNIGEAYATGIRESTAAADAAAAEMGASSVASLKEGSAGAGAVGATTGAAAGGAGGAGAGGAVAGAVEGEMGAVGRFGGIAGKFTKVLGPATKLMKPFSLGIRAIGGAFRFAMGPVGMIVLTLLPILWPLLVKLEKKTHIFSKALDVLTDAFSWLWDHALKPLFKWLADNAGTVWGAIETAIGGVSDAITWFWHNAVQPVFDWIKKNWPLLLAILTGPIGLAVLAITKNWDTIKKIVTSAVDSVKRTLGKIWDGITTGWNTVVTFFTDLWPKHLEPLVTTLISNAGGKLVNFFKGIIDGWWIIGTWIVNLWKNHVKPKLDTLVSNVKGKLENFFKGIVSGWWAVGTWVGNLWKNHIKPKITNLLSNAKTQLEKFFNGISSGFTAIKTWLSNVWKNHIKPIIGTLVSNAQSGLEAFWDGLKSGFKDAAGWVIDKLNAWLIAPINSALDHFNINFSIKKIAKPKGLAEGGLVTGPGGPKDDRILTRLSSGEYVLPAHLTKRLGSKNLDTLRKTGKLPPSAMHQLGVGGLWGTITGTLKAGSDIVGAGIHAVGDAFKKGASVTLGWLLDRLAGNVPNNFVGNFALGIGKQLVEALKPKAEAKDREIAAAKRAAAAAGKYTGPPGGWTYPLSGHYRISQKPNTGHNPTWSVDIAAPSGTTVRAASRGTVASVISLGNRSYGNYIVLNHARGQSTLYAHLQRFLVKKGQSVKTGQSIGISDTTGHAFGAHLHFELRPSSDTIAAMKAHGVTLAKGGVVGASPSGTMALLAEAGKSERVTPLDREGFTPAERKMLETLEAKLGGGGGDTIHVHPSQGMNEAHLADLVARRMAWKRRRGAGVR